MSTQSTPKPAASLPGIHLPEGETRFRNLIEQADYPILILKGENLILEVANEPLLQLWNVGNEAFGKPFLSMLPEMQEQGFHTLLLDVLHHGVTHRGTEQPAHFEPKNAEQKTVWFNYVFQPYKEDDGRITGVLVMATDVSEQVLARKKMEDQATMVQDLLMNAPGFVCTLKGPDHVYDLVNDQYQQLFGNRKIKGKPIMVALPELEGQGFDLLLDQVYGTGVPYVGYDIPITLARDQDRQPEVRYFNFSYQPIHNERKEIYSILVFGYEVTEEALSKIKNLESNELRARELEEKVQQRTQELVETNRLLHFRNVEVEEAREKLLSQYSRSLIEASLDPLITISAEGKITDMNKALSTITGHTREELIGTDFSLYFTDPQKAREIYKEVFANGFVTNYPLTIIDGQLTDVLFNGSVYLNDRGEVLGAMVVARVITEQRRIEKELIEARDFAEKATKTAEKAKRKAEEATKSKQQFLSNMSHEIRTPMNAIIGFTKVVLRTELTEQQKEYVSAIKVSGDSLIVLINDILDLAKVNAGKMTFEKIPFQLDVSVSSMLHLFETKIQEKNLQLIKEFDKRIPDVLVGDPTRLHQIILNLVGNAVKFTSKGKITVKVSLLHEDRKSATIEFIVSDTGIGIAKNKIKHIFENFHQVYGRTTGLYEGTGLGLSIVKHLIEPQGGTIAVSSKLDEGSVFRFTLTFQKTSALALHKPVLPEISPGIRDIKVLVVEDMALNQLLMKTLLDDFGFHSDIADNGKIALEKLKANRYDVVLMDLQMPEMNGFEATSYIRKKLLSDIPIIALTADVTTVDLAKCKASGMNDYIAKPVDEKLLFSKIVGLVKRPETMIENKLPLENAGGIKTRYTNLDYLKKRTKSDAKLMKEMISLYLDQTPQLIAGIKQNLQDQDWTSLQASIHKMIPSFSIVGISPDFEEMAKKIHEFAFGLQHDQIQDLVHQLEHACTQACLELEEELRNLIM